MAWFVAKAANEARQALPEAERREVACTRGLGGRKEDPLNPLPPPDERLARTRALVFETSGAWARAQRECPRA